MAKPAYKDLGISSKEYEEALLLERLFKLVKKNPCSTCLLKKPTHIDLDRFDLLCTTCSKRCSSKLQIGKGLISMSDLERLESIYDKSKRKGDTSTSKHKKHSHKSRSPSVSSTDSYHSYRKHDKYRSPDSEPVNRHRNKSKHSKRRDPGNYPPETGYYPEPHDRFSTPYLNAPQTYPGFYPGDRFQPQHKPHNDHREPREHKEKSKDKSRSRHKARDSFMSRDGHVPRDYETRRESHVTKGGYPQLANYPFYPQQGYPNSYPDPYQSSYTRPSNMKRNSTAYDYTNFSRRDVPGMMGLLANQGRQDMVFRNQFALPPPQENRDYPTRRDHRSQSLALTNGFQAFKSLPPFNKLDVATNNPFSKRGLPTPSGQPYDFSNMRDALNPPRTHSRYPEQFNPPHDFSGNKLGNPGFPDSSGNYFNRY